MTDTVVDMAWSNLHAGQFVRWATPKFIKYGVIVSRKNNSLTLDLLDEDRPRVIPDAKWYFVQAKMYGPDCEEHLVVLERLDDEVIHREVYRPIVHTDDTPITVAEACELIQMDPKQFRRHIRRGTITASKNKDGQWLLRRDLLMEVSAKYGWI